jgi:hypothetical protein
MMDTMKQTRLTLLAVPMCMSFILLTATACKKTAAPVSNAANQASPALSIKEVKEQRLAWNLKTLVEPYEHAGYTNSKWDASAKLALTEFAHARAKALETNESSGEIISTNVAAAARSGCDDPMVNYLFIKYAMDQTNSKETFVQAFRRTADNMQQSPYPKIRKFYASLRTAEQLKYAAGNTTNISPEEHEYRQQAIANLSDALDDKTIPIGEVDDACHEMLGVVERSQKQYVYCYNLIENPLFQNWPDESVVWLLKGEAHIKMAWFARGGGYANTVTDEGSKLFQEHLAVVEESLNHAWKLNPHDPRIAVKMMWVELGQGKGRDRMESWFHHAMELDPNNYDACSAKCLYLEPKWYGSTEEMIAFGRECVRTKEWGGSVPLTLVDAHRDIPFYYLSGSEKTNYWKQPQVWPDIKAAYDRFFELNPGAVGYYHNYAWYAYHAEQWDALSELISKLGPVNHEFFGGKDEFDKMVRLAKEHASKPK